MLDIDRRSFLGAAAVLAIARPARCSVDRHRVPRQKQKSPSTRGEEAMLEYFAYALLSLLVIGCILYVTLSPEVEEPPTPKRPDPKL